MVSTSLISGGYGKAAGKIVGNIIFAELVRGESVEPNEASLINNDCYIVGVLVFMILAGILLRVRWGGPL